jgi:hypothetical protein
MLCRWCKPENKIVRRSSCWRLLGDDSDKIVIGQKKIGVDSRVWEYCSSVCSVVRGDRSG